jgi:hypothetical protein
MEPMPRAPVRAPGNKEVEYAQAIGYIHHMYDTRHRIFQFSVALNTALVAGVVQFVDADTTRLALAIVGGVVSLVVSLMARRSYLYLQFLEQYTRELEEQLDYGLVRETGARMPSGIDSTVYFLFVYNLAIVIWLGVAAFSLTRLW